MITNGLKDIPQAYAQPCEEPGTLEQIPVPGLTDATVYLPYGYESSEERYPVFFLLHGGGGDQYSFFSEDGLLKNMLDHMIQNSEIKRMIVIAPSYYPPGKKGEGIAYSGEAVRDFGPILMKEIIPMIDQKYRTIPDRWSRAVGGFSMGAVATWFILMAGSDFFHWFMPMSGDCWICGERGGGQHPKQTAGLMATALQGKQFYVHALTGTLDIAYPNLDPQMRAIKGFPEAFGDNTRYTVLPEGVHDYACIRRYIYNALPEFFR